MNNILKNKRNENWKKKNCGSFRWGIPYLNNSAAIVYEAPNIWDIVLRHRDDGAKINIYKITIESTLWNCH